MKKMIIALLVLCFCLTGCDNNSKNQQKNNNYTATKAEYINSSNITNESSKEYLEEDLSSFSTKIYTPNDEGRQTNIGLTCSKLNGTIVKSRRNIFFL